jgi:hypothetical protein
MAATTTYTMPDGFFRLQKDFTFSPHHPYEIEMNPAYRALSFGSYLQRHPPWFATK